MKYRSRGCIGAQYNGSPDICTSGDTETESENCNKQRCCKFYFESVYKRLDKNAKSGSYPSAQPQSLLMNWTADRRRPLQTWNMSNVLPWSIFHNIFFRDSAYLRFHLFSGRFHDILVCLVGLIGVVGLMGLDGDFFQLFCMFYHQFIDRKCTKEK